MRAASAAAAKAAALIDETLGVLKQYSWHDSTEKGAAHWNVPAIRVLEWTDGSARIRAENLGRAWCLGGARSFTRLVVVEDGTLTKAALCTHREPPDPFRPTSYWSVRNVKGMTRARNRSDNDRLATEFKKRQLSWQEFSRTGLDVGERYFHVGWDSKWLYASDPKQIVPLTYEGWEVRQELETQGEDSFACFSEKVRQSQRERERTSACFYVFTSQDPTIRPVDCPVGVQLGVFEDGRPVLLDHRPDQYARDHLWEKESWRAWDLEQTLTQRVMCVMEEYRSL
ncbi:hypothetical protein [Nocardia sp. MW-W600-9]